MRALRLSSLLSERDGVCDRGREGVMEDGRVHVEGRLSSLPSERDGEREVCVIK